MRQALELALEALEDRTSLMKWQIARDAVKEALAQPERDYERGFIDGMQKQMQSSVDKAVNRMAQPEQEPVAYLCENAVGHKYFRWKKPSSTYKPIALYTTPPQRTWHGLTDEEIDYIYTGIRAVHHDVDSDVLCRAIEAKLKEKNGA